MTSSKEREFDIILWGASGFTGRLIAEYLLEHGPKDLRWALAGRNQAKLEGVRAGLAGIDERAKDLAIVIGDSKDSASLDAMVARTTVVCTTVGPYASYGSELVKACVDANTHYCDLTGESPWIRRMIDAHHQAAVENGTRIVHCCGFDSIPSDMGVFMLGDEFLSRGGSLEGITNFVGETKGGVSGGTIASMIGIMEEAKNKETRRVLFDPYGLNPQDQRSGPDKGDQMGVKYDEDMEMWTCPFVMAAINTRIVRRSIALRGFPYGRDFRYKEVMSTGKGVKGWMRASTMTFGLGAFVGSLKLPVIKHLTHKALPKPGSGPSKDQRESGFFIMRLLAKGKDKDGQAMTLKGRVEGKKDPGYGETAKMLAESALCLALDQEKLPKGGGVLTASTAMGSALLERLRTAGMVFEVRG